jgi:ribonuclease-3 family protein
MKDSIFLPALPNTPQAMSDGEVDKLSVLALAHVGDGVYELMVRTMLCGQGIGKVSDLHRRTVSYVCAPAQAKAIKKIMPILTEKEADVFRRGRNAHTNHKAKNMSESDYHSATGLECLFGYLYLDGQLERLRELYGIISSNDD